MKIAAFMSPNASDAYATVSRMLEAMGEHEGAPKDVVAIEGGAMGWIGGQDGGDSPWRIGGNGEGDILLVTGTPVTGEGKGPDSWLRWLMERSQPEALRVLGNLDGAFAIAHWEARSRRMGLVTDFLGMQPLHFMRRERVFAFATDARALLAATETPPRLDPKGWGSFFAFGHGLSDWSFFEGIKRVPAGSIMVHQAGDATAAEDSKYWGWPEPRPVSTLVDLDVGPIVQALRESVSGYARYGIPGTLLLSGGFDSRLVLFLLLEAGIPVRATVVKHLEKHFNADGIFARRVAQLTGVPYAEAEPPRDFFWSPEYVRYLLRSEVSNASAGLFIANVSSAVHAEMGAIWDGLAPQAMRRLSQDTSSFAAFLAPVERRMVRLRGNRFHGLFSREWAEALYEGYREARAGEAGQYPDDEYGVAEFSIRNRTRLRIATNPFRVFSEDVLVFTPGLAKAYYEQVGALNQSVKGDWGLTRKVLTAVNPSALEVPFCSGGKLVNLSAKRSPRIFFARTMDCVAGSNLAQVLLGRSDRRRRNAARYALIDRIGFDASKQEQYLAPQVLDLPWRRGGGKDVPGEALDMVLHWISGTVLMSRAAKYGGASALAAAGVGRRRQNRVTTA